MSDLDKLLAELVKVEPSFTGDFYISIAGSAVVDTLPAIQSGVDSQAVAAALREKLTAILRRHPEALRELLGGHVLAPPAPPPLTKRERATLQAIADLHHLNDDAGPLYLRAVGPRRETCATLFERGLLCVQPLEDDHGRPFIGYGLSSEGEALAVALGMLARSRA
jgi:hypothetical protein